METVDQRYPCGCSWELLTLGTGCIESVWAEVRCPKHHQSQHHFPMPPLPEENYASEPEKLSNQDQSTGKAGNK